MCGQTFFSSSSIFSTIGFGVGCNFSCSFSVTCTYRISLRLGTNMAKFPNGVLTEPFSSKVIHVSHYSGCLREKSPKMPTFWQLCTKIKNKKIMRIDIENMALLGPPSNIQGCFSVCFTSIHPVVTQKNCMKNSTQIEPYRWFPWKRLHQLSLFSISYTQDFNTYIGMNNTGR